MSDGPSQDLAAPPEYLDYSGTAGLFDEIHEAPGQPRPHWRGFLESLKRLGRHEMASRWESRRRILREHGVTYNVYGDPQGMDRPWDLDLVPLLLGAEEWAHLEAGLIQRARLFNLILADIYGGTQRLLRDGFLPPELVYANPGFLRPCRGLPIAANVYLHLHACDLGRSPDGQWWVLADRTEAPSGSGYAWENRTVISRVLPREIRECKVQRVGSFFRQQRQMLFDLAPAGRDQPNVVLLTPGPHNETYFEHAYLARHLGFALVEGADLTVRDRRVFLRTIEGLQPVDVILRRVDDWFCDPLELRGDSFLGVPGLVEAARAGNVTVANALGAGLMESPAFLAFLPGLCRHLLGEELMLASLATWWCGQAEELRYVTEHLGQLILKPAFCGPDAGPGRAEGGARITKDERKQMLRVAPSQFVAQEPMKLSQAPVWTDGRLVPRAIVLRAYVASGRDSFAVMPGGLTRVAKGVEDFVVTMQSGGGSKDTWILSNGASSRPEPDTVVGAQRPSSGHGGPVRSDLAPFAPGGVPSRAADSLYWLGRYTERLAQLLRVLRCILGRFSSEPGGEGPVDWTDLGEFAANLKLFPARPGGRFSSNELSERMLRVLHHPDQPGGVREMLGRIRFIAATVRDRFSGDMWRILGRLEVDGRARLGRLPLAGATTRIHQLVLDLAAFEGMEMENMTRGYGWRFLDFGRRLERGLSVIRLLAAAAGVAGRPATLLEPVLEIADSVMTYRRRYFAAPRWAGVLELLLRDETNPRSLAFQLEALREHAGSLAAGLNPANPEAEHERIRSLIKAVRAANLSDLAGQSAEGAPQPLLDLLANWVASMAALSDDVTRRYFSLTAPRVS
jgi:uncharacterized circularly permuted ATP-grasp superfamily protein/uncharacterized alpha-E superfamily protein